MAKICVLGAHTAMAKALVETLEERELEVELDLVTTSDHVAEGLGVVSEATLAASDLVVLAFKGPVARKLADAARSLGRPVLDLSEELTEDKRARWVFPSLDVAERFDPTIFSLVPIGLGAPLVSVLRALAPFRPERAAVSTYESTAAGDQPGMDELSEQVRARFNLKDVEAKVFAGPIAFSCLPIVGGPGDSPFAADDRLRLAVEAGLESVLPDLEVFVTRILVPTFSADSATLVVDLAEAPDTEAIAKALDAARGIHYLDEELPSSLEAIGRDDALVGRLTVDGARVGLWLACDRLRHGSATLAVLAIERWLAASAPR